MKLPNIRHISGSKFFYHDSPNPTSNPKFPNMYALLHLREFPSWSNLPAKKITNLGYWIGMCAHLNFLVVCFGLNSSTMTYQNPISKTQHFFNVYALLHMRQFQIQSDPTAGSFAGVKVTTLGPHNFYVISARSWVRWRVLVAGGRIEGRLWEAGAQMIGIQVDLYNDDGIMPPSLASCK